MGLNMTNPNDLKESIQNILERLDTLQDILNKKERPFLTIDEASEYLGISKNTLYAYTSRGILPFYKLQNRKIYFKIEELDDFILSKKNRIKSNQEIEEQAITEIVMKKVR